MDYVATGKAPKAIGSYSQAIKSNGFVFTSGQIALDKNGVLVEGGIREQTERVIKNLSEILVAAGSSLEKVVKVTVFLSDIKDFAEMDEVYAQYFTTRPARSTVAVRTLPKNVLVEIEAVAEE